MRNIERKSHRVVINDVFVGAPYPTDCDGRMLICLGHQHNYNHANFDDHVLKDLVSAKSRIQAFPIGSYYDPYNIALCYTALACDNVILNRRLIFLSIMNVGATGPHVVGRSF
jgi:hypothetical protein